jgi:hypothetical protein
MGVTPGRSAVRRHMRAVLLVAAVALYLLVGWPLRWVVLETSGVRTEAVVVSTQRTPDMWGRPQTFLYRHTLRTLDGQAIPEELALNSEPLYPGARVTVLVDPHGWVEMVPAAGLADLRWIEIGWAVTLLYAALIIRHASRPKTAGPDLPETDGSG